MQNPHAATPKAIVGELFEGIRRNSPERFADLVCPSHTDRSNGRNGPDGFAEAAGGPHRADSDFDIAIEALVAEGDLAVACWSETGTHTGPCLDLRPTGEPFEASGVNVCRVQNGEFVESWLAVDPRTIRARQQGQAAMAAQETRGAA